MIFILLIVDVLCFCYHLKNEENVESYIKDLTDKFGKDAGNTVFFGIIEPPVLTAGRLSYFQKFSCLVHKSSTLQFVC